MIGDILTVVNLVLILCGLSWGVFVYSRQMNAQLFLALTHRYSEIMSEVELDAHASHDIFADPPPPTPELTRTVMRYLNLCSEEFYLQQAGFLSKTIWRIWQDELSRSLSSELMQREWPKLRPGFDSFSEFQVFVDQKMRSAASHPSDKPQHS